MNVTLMDIVLDMSNVFTIGVGIGKKTNHNEERKNINMLNFLRHLFMYMGIYTTIASTWRLYEHIKYKKVTARNKDTIIALLLALIIWLFLI